MEVTGNFDMSEEKEHKSAMDSPDLTATPHGEFPSSRHLKWAVTFLLVYFGLRLLFFAIKISPFVPPDEVTHFGLSRIFSNVFFLPENSTETYQYGLVTNIPWLYYWIMGKLLAVNFFGLPDLLFLRLLNIPFAFGTVYFVWRTLRLLTDDRLIQLLLLVAMTNTLMFSFLSASVSYDNLLNLLAAMSIYYLLAFFKERSGNLLALCFLCQLAGSLTKITFLPLILVMNGLLLVHEFRHLRSFPRALPAWFEAAGWRGPVLVLGILLALALNIQLYGGNYLHFHSLQPEMYEVLPREIAMKNRLQARTMIFDMFKEGRVSKEKALEMTAQIRNSGDRADTVALIENYDDVLKGKGEEKLFPLEYTGLWLLNMAGTIYGIKAHQYMPDSGPLLYMFLALMLLSGIAFLVKWRPREAGAWLHASLAAIACFYAVFLLYFVNYQAYLDTKVFGMTVTGRYLLPIVGAIYVVSSYYMLRLFGRGYARLVIAVGVGLLFIASDFPFFLLHATPEWFLVPP